MVITWKKPNLGLFEVYGTRQNNVILANAAPVTHNFSPFLDTRTDVNPAQRFKALGGTKKSGLIAYVSADGIHWKKLQEKPVFTEGLFDSQNVSFLVRVRKEICLLFSDLDRGRVWGIPYSESYNLYGFYSLDRPGQDDFWKYTDGSICTPIRPMPISERRTFMWPLQPVLCPTGRSSPMNRLNS